jgi:DNA-binding FadR family transcriptional regulator
MLLDQKDLADAIAATDQDGAKRAINHILDVVEAEIRDIIGETA